MTMRRDFVANVAHELRTPVAAIRGAAETLLAGTVYRRRSEQSLEIVDRKGSASAPRRGLLELSRLEAGSSAHSATTSRSTSPSRVASCRPLARPRAEKARAVALDEGARRS